MVIVAIESSSRYVTGASITPLPFRPTRGQTGSASEQRYEITLRLGAVSVQVSAQAPDDDDGEHRRADRTERDDPQRRGV